MDEWGKFNKTSLPEKEEFYSNLNIEDITNADLMHVKGFGKGFVNIFGEYHALYLNSGTLLYIDAFENFRKVCLEIYHLDSTKFFQLPG